MNLNNMSKYLTTLALTGMLYVMPANAEDNSSYIDYGSQIMILKMNSNQLNLDLVNGCHAEYKVNLGLKVDLKKPYFLVCDHKHGSNLKNTDEGVVLAKQIVETNKGLLENLISTQYPVIQREGIQVLYNIVKKPDLGEVF